MGTKQDGRRKHFYIFFACLMTLPILLSGCAHFLVAEPDFEQAEIFAGQGNYNAAAARYEYILEYYPSVGDQALFQLGMIYLLPQNKYKDHYKALEYFQRLVNKYPKSRYRRDSDVFISLISEIANKDKRLNAQHRQINKLEQQINKLEQQISENEKKLELMKKIDMNLKKKKKIFP